MKIPLKLPGKLKLRNRHSGDTVTILGWTRQYDRDTKKNEKGVAYTDDKGRWFMAQWLFADGVVEFPGYDLVQEVAS